MRFSLALDEAARAPQHEDEGGVEAPAPTTVKAGRGSGRFPVITGTKSGAIEVRTYERVLRLEWRPAPQPPTSPPHPNSFTRRRTAQSNSEPAKRNDNNRSRLKQASRIDE